MNIKELLDKARKAIADGDFELAKTLKAQAQALIDLEKTEAEYGMVEADRTAQAAAAKALANETPTNRAGFDVQVTSDETDKAQSPYITGGLGAFLKAVKDAADGVCPPELRKLQSREAGDEGGFSLTRAMGPEYVGSLHRAAKAFKDAPTGIGESLPQTGGVLVGTDRRDSLLSRMYQIGQIVQRVPTDPVGPNSNGITYYAEDETSRIDGSRRGGVRAYWSAENSALTASAPTFRKMQLMLDKVTVLVYATEEQIEDTTYLGAYMDRILPEELRFKVEDGVVNGTGTGMPLGILNSAATVSQAKETGQAAATIVAENISKMWSRRWVGGTNNYVWLINQDIEPQLDALSYSVGTGGQLVYMPPGGLSSAPFGMLKGRPVIPVEYCETLGTVGDIILADLSQYQMIDKGGVRSASSIHVRFLQDEQVFKFVYRINGQPTWSSALTPFKGTSTKSPFVTLATRA